MVAFVAGARRTLDVALPDVRLPGPVGDGVREALEGAAERGVALRLLYNVDAEREIAHFPRRRGPSRA